MLVTATKRPESAAAKQKRKIKLKKNKESSGEQRKSVVEQVNQYQTDGSNKTKRSSLILLRSKKSSKSRNGVWTGESEKITGHEDETTELQMVGNDERQIGQGAKTEEVKSKEAEFSRRKARKVR